jgi:hypothetical protein
MLMARQSENFAALWSDSLGFPITAVPSNQESLDKLEEHLRGELGPVWGRDLALVSVLSCVFVVT